MEKREEELAYLLNNEEDFDALLDIYRRFNSEFPPEYFRKKKPAISIGSLPYFDYTPITPSGAWIRKPWKETNFLPNYTLLFGRYHIMS